MGIGGRMDFDGRESSLEVQSARNFKKNGLWHTGKRSGGPISKKFQVRLDFRRENTDSEVQSACLKRYKMLVRAYDTYR